MLEEWSMQDQFEEYEVVFECGGNIKRTWKEYKQSYLYNKIYAVLLRKP